MRVELIALTTRMNVHCYNLGCLKQRRKFQNGSPKLGVAYIGDDDMEISFTLTLRPEHPIERGYT